MQLFEVGKKYNSEIPLADNIQYLIQSHLQNAVEESVWQRGVGRFLGEHPDVRNKAPLVMHKVIQFLCDQAEQE